ncbi:Acetoacetate decarboxylase (ADC) [Amycolatopsis marina]|uniref:Acetoacetate decarboxylase (ADC) n=1 Tax=Amycolatopsis marina TaxID=490629 RepID=A0A1I0Z4H1_9PSEU|nr:acetoacetate decarboxylase family protein [Amycolatopsis marina]SFB20515.1 Acetoacetate decarboxylase (ADC) [Amycolatopsis marina]
MSGPEYPPEPWHLAGQGFLSAWQVPVGELPRLPAGVQPLTVAGRAVVTTAWIDYQDHGQLAYHELLAAVAIRGGLTATATITEIWVDSEVSLAGGRQLWGIPKDLADFDFRHGRSFTATASTPQDWIATAAFTVRGGPPVPMAGSFTIAQRVGDSIRRSPVRSRALPRAASANWNINPDGPLGYLAGRTPLLNLHARDFRLRFGG